MATASTISKQRTGTSIYGWIAPGLIAGMAMAMWSMTVAGFTSKIWAPPQGIAQAIGVGSQGHDLQLIPTMLGVIIHMVDSVAIGAAFVAAVLVLRLTSAAVIVSAGLVYGLAVYALMSRLVLDGVLSSNSGSFVSATPEWSSVVAHAVFGLALGALVLPFIRSDLWVGRDHT